MSRGFRGGWTRSQEGAWRQEQSADLQELLAVERRFVRAGERTVATGMGIDHDMSRDEEFGLAALGHSFEEVLSYREWRCAG